MARCATMTYNTETGKWTRNAGSSSSNSSSSPKKSSGGGSKKSGGSGGSGENLTSKASSRKKSDGKVEKKYNYIEYNTLIGTLSFIVNEKTIKLTAGDTVKLEGLGKYLSGNYFVKDVTRQISTNGYSHTATLIKTDFGSSLKTTTKSKDKKKTKTKKEKSSASKDNNKSQRTYTVKKGDCLWNIAKKFYGNGAAYTKIYDANTNKVADPNRIYPGQVFVIP